MAAMRYDKLLINGHVYRCDDETSSLVCIGRRQFPRRRNIANDNEATGMNNRARTREHEAENSEDNPTVDTWTADVEGGNIDWGRDQGRTNHVGQTVNVKMLSCNIQGLYQHAKNNDL